MANIRILPDDVINDYLRRNVRVVQRIVSESDITAMHANHAVLMSVVAQHVHLRTGVPFAIMPHGSAIEYAVKKDGRFWDYANAAFTRADRLLVGHDPQQVQVLAVALSQSVRCAGDRRRGRGCLQKIAS